MASLKQILSISLPVTIILVIVAILGYWNATLVGTLVLLAIIQGIFWKFVKWT
ncbi:hypothetical protein KAR91_34830 [Candidatus Pacearchaeota archaeon]|nr:hypothetical protein [Candidatus Pacearchaeota archaeon]